MKLNPQRTIESYQIYGKAAFALLTIISLVLIISIVTATILTREISLIDDIEIRKVRIAQLEERYVSAAETLTTNLELINVAQYELQPNGGEAEHFSAVQQTQKVVETIGSHQEVTLVSQSEPNEQMLTPKLSVFLTEVVFTGPRIHSMAVLTDLRQHHVQVRRLVISNKEVENDQLTISIQLQKIAPRSEELDV